MTEWSPEQIRECMKLENNPYCVCHETIYQHVYQERQGKTWHAYLTRAKPKRGRGRRKRRKMGLEKYLYIRSIQDQSHEIMTRQQIDLWETDTIEFSSHKYKHIAPLANRKSHYLIMVKNNNRSQSMLLFPIIERKVIPDSIVYSDSWRGYNVLDASEFKHYRINHSQLFADKHNHINGIENFWNQAKRHTLKFNGVPKKNFWLFLKECEWRFNNPDPKAQLIQLKQWTRDILN